MYLRAILEPLVGWAVARIRYGVCLAVLLAAAAGSAATFQSVNTTYPNLYQSVDQLNSWVSSFSTTNSDIVQLYQYGTSYQGRPLWALEITEHPGVNDPAKPEFLFTGGMHAREVIGSQAAYQLAEHLVQGYRSGDAACQAAVDTREIWIVPDQNPDGRIQVEAGNSVQRTNMQGVDLNRNFPHRWSDASSWYGEETYRGPSLLSTPEDSAMWAMLHDPTKFSNLEAAIDFHSGAATLLSPWTSPNDTANLPPQPVLDKLSALKTKMSQLTGLSTSKLSYDSYGTLTDSLYEEFQTYAFTEELYQSYGDYFTMFNPLTPDSRDTTVQHAVDSSMYLLSPQAFPVPEPGTMVLVAVGVAAVVGMSLRRRRGRWAVGSGQWTVKSGR